MDISRYECNSQVRTILTQHHVNLFLVDYSCIGTTVYLSGAIKKDFNEEFTQMGLEALESDIRKIRGVREVEFNLENWEFNKGQDSWQIKRSSHEPTRISHGQGAGSTDNIIEIKNVESIADVLRDNTTKREDKDKKSGKINRD